MTQAEKLNTLKEYFKEGIKRLLENPESAFGKSINVQEAIFNSMPKEGFEMLKEANTQFGGKAINDLMTTSMTELLVESPGMMADLLKQVVDFTAKLETEAEETEKHRMAFRELVKEVSEKTGEPGSRVILGLDYRESIDCRIEQLKEILISKD
jgi:hypothetical protein